jgi:hypothetical protein
VGLFERFVDQSIARASTDLQRLQAGAVQDSGAFFGGWLKLGSAGLFLDPLRIDSGVSYDFAGLLKGAVFDLESPRFARLPDRLEDRM